jgi:hypothetical protein
MQKYLVFGASALALGFGVSVAHAEDPLKLTLSGGAQEAFGYVGNPDSKNNNNPGKIYQFGDGSVAFDAKTKLDNGITVEFNAALNISGFNDGGAAIGSAPAASGGQALATTGYAEKNLPSSENDWIAFSGSFGKFEIGDDFNAAFQAHNDAPYFGAIGGFNWGRNSGFIGGPVLGAAGPHAVGNQVGNIQTVMFDDYEASKVVYTTPSFGGFGVTASFTPEASSADFCCGALSQTGGNAHYSGGTDEAVAAFYKGDMGDAKFNADVGYVQEQAGGVRGIDFGVSVNIKGFTVGGSFVNRAHVGSATELQKIGDTAGNTYDIGIGYESGPWGVTIGYMDAQGEAGNGILADSQTGFGGAVISGEQEFQMVPVTAKYTIGQGITLNLETGYEKWTTPDGKSQDNYDGFYGLLGTTVSF